MLGAWSVASTRMPLLAARTAVSAVSASRTSPTMITSGFCRKIARSMSAKLMPWSGLTWLWRSPSTAYSTGSSIVLILRVPSLSFISVA